MLCLCMACIPTRGKQGNYTNVSTTSFCSAHASTEDRPTWLLHRDILHALNMPLVALFHRASALASAALCSTTPSDLELAFSGDARSAFLWLQCFFSEEEAWVRTSGCPECVVTETLSTESHLRLTIAASLLSTASTASPGASVAASTDRGADSGSDDAQTQAHPQLPPIPHIIPALRAAVEADPFWGPDYWPYLFSRANQLSASIQALMSSMADLESLVASPSPSSSPSQSSADPSASAHPASMAGRSLNVGRGTAARARKHTGVPMKQSKLAQRQMRMQVEEMELLRRCAVQCWGKAMVPKHVRGAVLGAVYEGAAERASRGRSSTCP